VGIQQGTSVLFLRKTLKIYIIIKLSYYLYRINYSYPNRNERRFFKIMKISVMGIEYNQLLSGKILAEMGNDVMHISKDNKRIENIKRGFYNAEEAMVIKNVSYKNSVTFTSNIKDALRNTNMCFISEGYGENSDESMENVLKTAKEVGANMSKHMFIIDRAATCSNRVASIKEVIQEELSKRNEALTFEVIANPDFLRA
jgi:UDPglucose 6-dehydrogenase